MRWSRIIGILFGLGTQVLFLLTVGPLYGFLRNNLSTRPEGGLLIDFALAAQFAILHSVFLHYRTREWLNRWMSREFFHCAFCVQTCLSLWLVMAGWRGSSMVVFAWPRPLDTVITGAFFAGWILLFYSLSLSGLGYQTGLLPWWCWFRGQPQPRRDFKPIGLYRVLRHPVYLSFLMLIWFTPVVTADRAVLIVVWTAYAFFGSHLKDERMAWFLGDVYRKYQAEVPGFPGWPWGPLGRRPLPLVTHEPSTAQPSPA